MTPAPTGADLKGAKQSRLPGLMTASWAQALFPGALLSTAACLNDAIEIDASAVFSFMRVVFPLLHSLTMSVPKAAMSNASNKNTNDRQHHVTASENCFGNAVSIVQG